MPEHPHFLCIGAMRSGTTWLYDQLRRQPRVWVPPLKELHYFDTRDSTVPREARFFWRQHLKSRIRHNLGALVPQPVRARLGLPSPRFDPIWDATYFLAVTKNLKWYTMLFQRAARRGYVTGEITPAYSLLSMDMIRTIHEINPALKVIFVMRNPLERMWSHAVKNIVRDKRRPISDVSDAEFLSFIRSEECILPTDYRLVLDRWMSVFPSEQIFLEYFDNIRASPVAVLQNIATFLGVEFRDNGEASRKAQSNAAAAGLPIPDAVRREAAIATVELLAGLAGRLKSDVVSAWLRDTQLLLR